MVTLVGIQEDHPPVPRGRIHQLINLWHGENILGVRLVQAREVDADSPCPVLFLTTTVLLSHSG